MKVALAVVHAVAVLTAHNAVGYAVHRLPNNEWAQKLNRLWTSWLPGLVGPVFASHEMWTNIVAASSVMAGAAAALYTLRRPANGKMIVTVPFVIHLVAVGFATASRPPLHYLPLAASALGWSLTIML